MASRPFPWVFRSFSLVLVTAVSAQPPTFNYAEALQKSIFFYEAQQSGVLPATKRVTWRGDSGLNDGADVGVNLTGGWYDAGDHVKFGLPMAFSATALAWGAIDFREGYLRSGQLPFLKNNLRFVNDYFIKAHTAPNELWGQVGKGEIDHQFWGSAEILMMDRPAAKIDTTHPGSELAAETAAAMAAASIVFATDDPAYSALLLRHAVQLYNFADTFRGSYSVSIPASVGYYTSFSGFNDELVWGAIWLYRATGDITYLNKAEALFADLRTEPGSTEKAFDFTVGWDDKSFGCYVLLAKLTGKAIYKAAVERNLDYWTVGINGKRVRYTPGGLASISTFGKLSFAANASFLALYYHELATSAVKDSTYYNFAVQQINYMLGANPLNRSYVVGFGANPSRNIFHRTAHGTWTNSPLGRPVDSRHFLYGALLGGPSDDDQYAENRDDFQHSDVATNYNALFSGALAKLVTDFGGVPLANFPTAETPSDEFIVDAKLNVGAGFSDFTVGVNNHSAWPARIPAEFKFRIFVDLSEGLATGLSVADYLVSSSSNVTITPLQRWGSGPFHYIEATFVPGIVIWPGGLLESRKEAQIRIGLRPTAPITAWRAANDWSSVGVDETLKPVEVIPLYADGLRVTGSEPPPLPLPQVTGVVLSPTSTALNVGASTQFLATVAPANALNKTVSWKVLNPAIATVNATGIVTAVAPGTTTITVTTVDGNFTASSLLAVNGVAATGVNLTPTTATLTVGATLALNATVAPANATIQTVTWTTSDPTVAIVTSSGLVIAFSRGNATITATAAGGTFATSAIVVNSGCANPMLIRLNFAKDGAGEFCYVTNGDINFVNSWNMQLVEINGVPFTNRWSSSPPPRLNGGYTIRYIGTFPWSHLEINGSQ